MSFSTLFDYFIFLCLPSDLFFHFNSITRGSSLFLLSFSFSLKIMILGLIIIKSSSSRWYFMLDHAWWWLKRKYDEEDDHVENDEVRNQKRQTERSRANCWWRKKRERPSSSSWSESSWFSKDLFIHHESDFQTGHLSLSRLPHDHITAHSHIRKKRSLNETRSLLTSSFSSFPLHSRLTGTFTFGPVRSEH